MCEPIAEVVEVVGPSEVEVVMAGITVAAWFHVSEEEDEEGEDREERCEGEEEEAESDGHGLD